MMTLNMAATYNATYNGQPLSVLAELIAKRRELMHETAKDAVVATGITVLKSLRALTKRYKGKVEVKRRGR